MPTCKLSQLERLIDDTPNGHFIRNNISNFEISHKYIFKWDEGLNSRELHSQQKVLGCRTTMNECKRYGLKINGADFLSSKSMVYLGLVSSRIPLGMHSCTYYQSYTIDARLQKLVTHYLIPILIKQKCNALAFGSVDLKI